MKKSKLSRLIEWLQLPRTTVKDLVVRNRDIVLFLIYLFELPLIVFLYVKMITLGINLEVGWGWLVIIMCVVPSVLVIIGQVINAVLNWLQYNLSLNKQFNIRRDCFYNIIQQQRGEHEEK